MRAIEEKVCGIRAGSPISIAVVVHEQQPDNNAPDTR
jgi:hypothetical protein